MNVTIEGNTIFQDGKPVAALLDIDAEARKRFYLTMAKLAMLDQIEQRVAEANKTLPILAEGVTYLANTLRIEIKAPQAPAAPHQMETTEEEDVFS